MATERLPMRKTKEILRQKWVLGRRHRQSAEFRYRDRGHHQLGEVGHADESSKRLA